MYGKESRRSSPVYKISFLVIKELLRWRYSVISVFPSRPGIFPSCSPPLPRTTTSRDVVVPPGRAVAIPLGCGGSLAPHRVEIVPLYLEAFFTSSSKSFVILLGLLCFSPFSRFNNFFWLFHNFFRYPRLSPRTSAVEAWRPSGDSSRLVTRWTLASTAVADLPCSLASLSCSHSPTREATVPSVDVVVSALHSSLYHSNIYSRAWPRSSRAFTPIHGRVPTSLPSRLPTILALCSHDVIKLEYWAHVG